VYFNYAYLAGWLALMLALIAATVLLPWALPFAVIASFRFLEVVVWYLKLLFDRTHEKLYSPERNLLCLVLDAGSTVIACGLWLTAATVSEGATPWSAAIATFTLNGTPTGYEGWKTTVATAVGTLGGLILLGAGLALLVGLIARRFETHPWEEEYTGPRYPPKPTRTPWERRSS
jgi:hypothetical protein